MRVHVIVNANAAKFEQHPEWLDEMRSIGRNALSSVTSVAFHVTRSLGELSEACRRTAEQGADLIVICGGDGSAMAGVTQLHQTFGKGCLPTICLAPGGSSCTVARNWGPLRGRPAAHLAQLLARAHDGGLPIVPRPTLKVADHDGVERIGFIFGAGLVASFFRTFYEQGGGGYPEASQLVARVFLGSFVGGALARKILTPVPCTLYVDGRKRANTAYTLIVSAVVRNLGLHLQVPYRAAEDPKRPHLVASSLGALDCGRQFGRVLRGKPLIHSSTVDQLACSFRVDFPALTGTYVLDGDLLSTRSVTVSAGPIVRIASLPWGVGIRG